MKYHWPDVVLDDLIRQPLQPRYAISGTILHVAHSSYETLAEGFMKRQMWFGYFIEVQG